MLPVNKSEKKHDGLASILRADMARAFSSWPFYTAVIGVAAINLLNVWDELQYWLFTINDKPTVFYMYYIHNASGPHLAIFLCALPFATSFCTDLNNRYIRYTVIRSSARSYGWSKVIVTALTGFLAVFIGTSLFLGVLGIFLPCCDAASFTSNAAFISLLSSGGPFVYFAVSIFFNSLGYAFLAIFALWVSTKIPNIFVVMSSPIIFYYGWQYLCGAIDLPEIVRFQHIMNSSFLQKQIANIGLCTLYASAYFLILVALFGELFCVGVSRRMKNG